MTPTHTMRIPVRAWQVGPDGSLPEEAQDAIRWHCTEHGERHWAWVDPGHLEDQQAYPGDWIVQSEYGVRAMTDAEFRALCEEVQG